LDIDDYPRWYGLNEFHNNRSLRFKDLIAEEDRLSWEDFKRIKYDLTMPAHGAFHESLRRLMNLDRSEFDESLRPLIDHLGKWDLTADTNDVHAGALLLVVSRLFVLTRGGSVTMEQGLSYSEAELVAALEFADDFLRKGYGRLDVPMRKLQRLERGGKSFAMEGSPDVIAAINSVPNQTTKRLEIESGESYIQLVRYDSTGAELVETINAYGSSNRPDSPHYTDQMDKFRRHDRKRMTFDEAMIRANAERIYHPGE
jgi:acyl-homoserine-lactone acylase